MNEKKLLLSDANVNCVEIVEVIRVEFARGAGTEGDPVRTVTQYWSKENQLLVEFDSRKESSPN